MTNPISKLYVAGDFTATGTKNAEVNTSKGIVKLTAIEAPTVDFVLHRK